MIKNELVDYYWAVYRGINKRHYSIVVIPERLIFLRIKLFFNTKQSNIFFENSYLYIVYIWYTDRQLLNQYNKHREEDRNVGVGVMMVHYY